VSSRSGLAEDMKGHPWLAASLDWMMRPLYPARREVVPQAKGRVLEIGVGTGLNLGLYRGIDALVTIEPDPFMAERARPRLAELPFPAELREIGAEALPFDDAEFDTVVCTFTLCTIPDTDTSLAGMHRVLKPGGRLLFAEHTRSEQPIMQRLQDGLTPLWKRIGGGCHLNRPAPAMIEEAGFEVESVTPFLRVRWTALPVYYGTAVRVG